MSGEEWRPIAGFPGYEVSNLGRVLSYQRKRPRELRGCVGASGYLKVDLVRDRKKITHNVHVLICEAFHGARPEGMWVRHLDGNKANNTASNLAWGSPAENAADTRAHGTHANGRKTHCHNGHPLVDGNLYRKQSGHRNCRTCALDYAFTRYWARKAQAAHAPQERAA